MQTESALRQAIQQQLDLILKIEQERKGLKKQNKYLKEQHQKLIKNLKKYNTEKQEFGVNTNTEEYQSKKQNNKKQQKKYTSTGFQADLQPYDINSSKLSSAQMLLKEINHSNYQSLCSKCSEKVGNSTITQEISERKPQNVKGQQQISSQILKMAKQITTLKKQLKDSQNRNKQKDKQLKQVKKCLQLKSQLLDKSRKQFNQLSQVFNTDKYKSLKTLQQELSQLRQRNFILEDQNNKNTKLRQMLTDLTLQYEDYKQSKQMKIQSLLHQLKNKDQQYQGLLKQKEKINFIQRQYQNQEQ